MRLPARKHFWVARLMDAKRNRNILISKKKKLKKEVVVKVIADSPVRITQSAAETAAEKHESLVVINDKITELDCVIEYLEKVEKIFSNMHWEIKNIVDINKMEQL